MKIFTKNSIVRKIIIAIVIVILFNFIAPNISKAADDEDWGGVLFTPIQALLLGFGDVAMYLTSATLQADFKTDNIITISTDSTKWYEKLPNEILLNVITGGMYGIAKYNLTTLDKLHIIDAPKEIVPDVVDLPLFTITPEKIFSNEVPFLDINIINPNYQDTATSKLQGTVSSWYLALRNLAIIAMLSILVYIGIRILLSSTAADKAKYKENIKDWIVAICLLFFMHYIMSFAITMVEELTKSLKTSIQVPVLQLDLSEYDITPEQEEVIKKVDELSGGNGDISNIKWATDFSGITRFRAQLDYDLASSDNADYVAQGGKARMAYTLMYVILAIYTIMFVFQYLKRLIYIIFLTMIAPLVAMTYPIDKMNDGSAQAFNMWLKEYIFNLLLQPFHLLIYSMLIGSAIELATDHLTYTLAVLGFMLPAEKILRKFFGFEKASAGSSIMGGVVGGQLVMSAINSISSRTKGGAKKGASGGSNVDAGKEKIRMDDRSKDSNAGSVYDLLDGGDDSQGQAPKYDNIEEQRKAQLDDINDYYEDEGMGRPYESPYSDEEWEEIHGELPLDSENNNIRTAPSLEESDISTDVSTNVDTGDGGKAIKGPKKHWIKAPLKMAGRGALKLGKGVAITYGAATLGAVGIAAGLASEDYSNVAKYGAAAGAAGSALTKAAMNKGKQLPSNIYRKTSAIKDQFHKDLYEDPSEYKKYMNRQADNAFMKDKDVQKKYRDKFGKDYIKAMEKAKKYREHGITDNDVIIKAMKANVKGVSDELDSNQRIAAAKFASQVSNEKDIETVSNRLKEKGIKEDKIKVQKDILRQIKDLN